jgi:hypothetical protein
VEENLLGRLLNANDPATDREVERWLAAHPAAARHLDRLRAALAPLAADRDESDPPADLWARTLARVAEHVVATEGPQTRPEDAQTDELIRRAAAVTVAAAPAVVTPAPTRSAGPPPARRRNVVGTVALSVAVLALVFPGVVHMRAQALRTGCQDNMMNFYQAAVHYADTHDGRFPQVVDGKPAASAAETLKVAGFLADDARLTCPARPDDAAPVTLANYAYTSGSGTGTGSCTAPTCRPGASRPCWPTPRAGRTGGRSRSTTGTARTCCSPTATCSSARR